MNIGELKKQIAYLRPAIALERVFPYRNRIWFVYIFGLVSLVLLLLSSGIFFQSSAQLSGFFFISLVVFMLGLSLNALYYSYACEDKTEAYLFDLALLVFRSEADAVRGFVRSSIGRSILLRAGIPAEEQREYLTKRVTNFSVSVLPRSSTAFASYLSAIVDGDEGFRNFLLTHGLDKELFVQCGLFVARAFRKERNRRRWWSRERLEAIPSLGRDWAYGKAYTLMRFSHPLRFSLLQDEELHSGEVLALENALTRGEGANALLIGEEGVGKVEVIEGLARKVIRSESSTSLHDKHFFVLDLEALASEGENRATFEKTFLAVCEEAAHSGNIVLVIPDLPRLLELGEAVEADSAAILIRFLASSDINIIAISDSEAFHSVLERHGDLVKHLVKIEVAEGGEHAVLRTLEDSIAVIEAGQGVSYTYTALYEVVASARRYFVGAPLFDTAYDLLIESAARVKTQDRSLVYRDDVLALVKEKTGVPAGAVEGDEQKRLANLEKLLHERVIGQDEAIVSISDALRRARSGINNPNRPIASFLFLGPTGVGKTETTKALSEVFFGHNVPLLRLDMSEYNTPDSVNRLIGGYGAETPGVLTSMLRDHPYGVLLLDEFEKTDPHVLDLFLQVLDEGIVSDTLGRKASARNLIIIATSNAGSQYIFETVRRGGDLVGKRDEVVEKLISDHIFKPELVNRFDGVILFHPLSDAQIRDVARIMLERLAFRLKSKGMTLVINDVLIEFLAARGVDPKFGARSLNRVIQDTVEKIIAERILSGQYKPGSKIELYREDLP